MLRSGLLSLLLFTVSSLVAQLHTPQYFSQYTHGTGWSLYFTDILIGDINLDTVPDVIFTMAEGYQVGYGHIKDGRISFEMEPVDYFKHGWWYFKGQLVDYDKDGDLDFLTASSNNFDFDNTYIMENEGGQLADTFRLAYPEFPAKTKVLFSKFNQDEVDDLLFNHSQPLGISLQDGATGEFQTLPFSVYNTNPRDFNHDGLMDFHATSANSPVYHTQTDILYLNQGDYTFTPFETPGYLSHPAGLANPPWGDFDGDGLDDQFAKPLGMSGLSLVFKSKMNIEGAARYDTLIITPAQPFEAKIVQDITGDGTEDMIAFTQDSLFWIETDDDMHFNVYGWPGDFHPGMIRTHPDLPPGTWIAMTDNGLPLLMQVYYSDSTGLIVTEDFNAFSPYVICESTYASPMTHTDVDADGQNELCIVAEYALAFAEIQSDQSLSEAFIQAGFSQSSGRGVSSGDWDGDGHDDLILNEGDSIYVMTRQADSTWSKRTYLTYGRLLDAHDFDRNGYTDLLIGIIDSTFILYNDQGSFVEHEVLAVRGAYPEFNVIDANQDGYPDVALSWDSTFVYMNQGDRTFNEGHNVMQGRLAHNTLPDEPYVFTILSQQVGNSILYRPNLFRILPDGQEAQWITGYVFIDSIITNREAWLVRYDGDSIPDMLFNIYDVPTQEWKAILVNEQEAVYNILNVHNSFLLGAEDVAGDGYAEVMYVKGSIAYLENGLPGETTSTHQPERSEWEVILYPNPLSSGSAWTLSYESQYTGKIWIDLFLPTGQLLQRYERDKSETQFISTFDGIHDYQGPLLIRLAEDNNVVFKKMIVLGG